MNNDDYTWIRGALIIPVLLVVSWLIVPDQGRLVFAQQDTPFPSPAAPTLTSTVEATGAPFSEPVQTAPSGSPTHPSEEPPSEPAVDPTSSPAGGSAAELIPTPNLDNLPVLEAERIAALTATGGSNGDVNGDGAVDIFDVASIAARYGSDEAGADINRDGIVDIFDLALVVGQFSHRPDDPLERQALQTIAGRYDLPPAALQIIHSMTTDYPLAGQKAHRFKATNNRTGEIYAVALAEDGTELDAGQLEANEQAVYQARYGRLDPALTEQVTIAAPEAAIAVIIWLKEPAGRGPERPEAGANMAAMAEAQAQDFIEQVDAGRAATVERVNAPVAARLESLGYEVESAPYAPVIYAALPQPVIAEAARWAEVDRIYPALPADPPEPLPPVQAQLNVAQPATFANLVHSRGINGAGVRVGVIEVEGRVATANPYLPAIIQDPVSICPTVSAHSTAVVGIILSSHPSNPGIAPGATVRVGGSCLGDSAQLQTRSTAAVNWGARVLNLSWGADSNLQLTAKDRFYDDLVMNRGVTVVKSAGNAGCAADTNGNINSPGLAYNIITVGNFDDQGTIGLVDDQISACSSWRDPASGDREKPEVAAPGSSINTTSAEPPWLANQSGTSFAAPMVAGQVALLMQRNPTLQFWPEAVKAIVMTTALHNIEVESMERDGAGGIYADWADDVARGVNGDWRGLPYSCSSADPLDVMTMPLKAGKLTRAVIAWDNPPPYPNYDRQPSADLDLQIVNPSGAVVTSAASYDNTYEVVDFKPAVTGDYMLRVRQQRCNASPRYLGAAWFTLNQ